MNTFLESAPTIATWRITCVAIVVVVVAVLFVKKKTQNVKSLPFMPFQRATAERFN